MDLVVFRKVTSSFTLPFVLCLIQTAWVRRISSLSSRRFIPECKFAVKSTVSFRYAGSSLGRSLM